MPRSGLCARRWGASALGMLLLLWAGAAQAQSAANRIAIEEFEGRDAKAVRIQVIAALERQGYELVGAKEIAGAWRRLGLEARSDADYAALARELDVAAVVQGVMGREGRNVTCELSVRNGRDGSTLESIVFRARRVPALTGVVKQRAWESLRDPLQRAEPPGLAAEPAPLDPALIGAQPPVEVPLEEVLDDPASPAAPPLRLDAGLGILTRQLNYNDDVNGVLRPYSSGVHPTINLRAEVYPAAFTMGGLAADFGLVLGYQHIFVSASQTSDGAEFPTSASALSAGLVWRAQVAAPLQLRVEALYGQRSFTVEDAADGTPKPVIPSVGYQRLDLAAGARWSPTPRFGLHARLAYLLPLSGGEFTSADYFSRASIHGVQGGLGVRFGLVGPLALDLGVAIERYASTFNTQPGDPFTAGGAVDQYITAGLGVAAEL